MGREDVMDALTTFATAIDLTEYEVEAYVTVLEHGDLTASEIAEETALPQPRVYDTVRSLADRGLVELRESRPMRVVAVDPAESFGELEASLSSLADTLEAQYVAPTPANEVASLVKSRSSILRYFEDVIESATYELAVTLTPRLVERFEPELRAAIDRDVRTSLVVTPAADAPAPDTFAYEAVATAARARRGVTTPVLAVADGTYSVYATQPAVREDGDHYAVIFNRSALGFLVLRFFGTVIWSTADERLLEGQPSGDLPRQYASLRRCLKDIQGVDGPLYARIAGQDVVTGANRRVVGEIVSTEITENEEIATMMLESDDERIAVGGRVAAFEDIEAHEIEVATQPFPRRSS